MRNFYYLNYTNMRKSIYIFCLLLICSFHAISQRASSKKPIDVFGYSCFQNNDETWGYDILRSEKIFIHQPTIPAASGLKGFSNKQSASAIAELAIKKLKRRPNEFPTIT